MCDASPANLSDPLLKVWKKSSHNPIKAHSPQTTGPLGCTSAWKVTMRDGDGDGDGDGSGDGTVVVMVMCDVSCVMVMVVVMCDV